MTAWCGRCEKLSVVEHEAEREQSWTVPGAGGAVAIAHVVCRLRCGHSATVVMRA